MTIIAFFILFILLVVLITGALILGVMAMLHASQDTARDDRNPVNPSH